MSNKQTTELQANTASDDKTAPKMGRPTLYTPLLGDMICARIADGETLSEICRDRNLPARYTVLRWRRKFPDFAADYARAREDWAEVKVDECVEIADDSVCDTVIKTGRNGAEYEAIDHENIQRSKLRVDTRWRVIQALNARYADKQTVEHSGTIEHEHTVASLSDREKMRRLALFMLEDKQAEPIEGQAIEQPEPIESQRT